MYQFGQGVKTDNARALTWYGLAADLGNTQGQNNLQILTDNLQDDGGELQNATRPISDPIIAQAQRWATIKDLHARIDKAEAEALSQDDYADEFEHFGKGKQDALAKVMNAMGSVPAVKYRIQAEKYRAEAARLRDQLAEIETQNQSVVAAP
jgi:hypothetical protein